MNAIVSTKGQYVIPREYGGKREKKANDEMSGGVGAFVGALDDLADQALMLAQTTAAMVQKSPEETVLDELRLQMPGLSKSQFMELIKIGKHPEKATRNELLRIMLAVIEDFHGKRG